jgi:DNA-binding MarR family transcriptional regulator
MARTTEAAIEELAQAAWHFVRRVRAEANDDELTWSQLSATGQLARNGAMTTAELARAESVKPQSMSATLAALEERGLVERRRDPTDGRQILFALTKVAVARRMERSRIKREWLATAFARLDASERRALIDAVAPLKRLANA